MLKFTIASFRKFFYDVLAPHEKQDYHSKIVDKLEKETSKCNTCGGGKFLITTSKDEFDAIVSIWKIKASTRNLKRLSNFSLIVSKHKEVSQELNVTAQRRKTFQTRYDRLDTRRSTIFVADTNNDKKRDSASIRRISILPTYIDETDGEYMCIPKSYQTLNTCMYLHLTLLIFDRSYRKPRHKQERRCT